MSFLQPLCYKLAFFFFMLAFIFKFFLRVLQYQSKVNKMNPEKFQEMNNIFKHKCFGLTFKGSRNLPKDFQYDENWDKNWLVDCPLYKYKTQNQINIMNPMQKQSWTYSFKPENFSKKCPTRDHKRLQNYSSVVQLPDMRQISKYCGKNNNRSAHNSQSPNPSNQQRSRQKKIRLMKRVEVDQMIIQQRDQSQSRSDMAHFMLAMMSRRQHRRQFNSLFIDEQYSAEVDIFSKSYQTKGLHIYNKHGSIFFQQPINLDNFNKRRLHQFVQISHWSIQIHEPELKDKLCTVELEDYLMDKEIAMSAHQKRFIKDLKLKSNDFFYSQAANKAIFVHYRFK